ncbi:MAG: HD domain-containing protein [Acidobacteriota bacterium]
MVNAATTRRGEAIPRRRELVDPASFALEDSILDIPRAVQKAGGRAVVVGGWVRDRLLGKETKDWDFEVYGLPLERLEEVLATLGEVIAVGRAFGVLKIKGLDADVSLPRRDNKVGRGHRGFVVELDPDLSFAEAAKRRDLTCNALAFDPLDGELLDAWGGLEDLAAGVLRAVDEETFAEDTLRGLRAAQFSARLEMPLDPALSALCARLDLRDLPAERLYEEMRKLLLKAARPSVGLEVLRRTGMWSIFPELEALWPVPQDPEWHPEGDVWTHTLMVVDEAASLRSGDEEDDLTLMFGALCHDLGKATTTVLDRGRVRSPAHEGEEGCRPTREFLQRLRAPGWLVKRVEALVRHHLAPALLPAGGATPRGYRRLARRLAEAEVPHALLHRLATADHFGRETPDALAREFPEGEAFLQRMEEVLAEAATGRDLVLGRHVLARGFSPGPLVGEILKACRERQDETGASDPEALLDEVLAVGPWTVS